MAKELTKKQELFMKELRERGFGSQGAIIKELNYTSFYRDRKNKYSALSLALKEYQDDVIRDISNSKGGNLDVIAKIRDAAVANDDYKSALAAAKLINDMQGHNAPKTQVKTNIKVNTFVDLTKAAQYDEHTGENIYDEIQDAEEVE